MAPEIIEKIRTADNLPSLPTVAVQVLELTQADEVSISEIGRVIQQDPALTARVLRVVNSSLFGMSRRVSSLQQAMVVLGLRTVKVMVLSFSLVDTMRSRQLGGFDYPGYWRRSLTTAVASKLLAEEVRRALVDEAFIGGLLCDLGMLAAFHCARDLYMPVVQRYDTDREPVQAIEQALLNVTHEHMTADLLNHWGLPVALCRAVATHHSPLDAPTSDDPLEAALTRILRSAALIADLFCADVGAGKLEQSRNQIIQHLPIGRSQLNAALDTIDRHVKETASLFALNIGPTRAYQDIQAEACVQLARLTMAAELERAQIAQREEAVRRQVNQLSDENQKLAQRAATDGLTGVANRAAFEERFREMCAGAVREGKSIGLLLLDLDRFKKLNDTFGHPAGDQVLRQVGAFLSRICSDTHFAARYGGEEFALVVADTTPRELREIAEELRSRIQQLRIPFGNRTLAITTSVGGVYLPPGDPDIQPHILIERADQCLYDAKHGGRNRVIVHIGRRRYESEVSAEC